MNETDLTKLARWIVPGWIAILSFYGLVLVDIWFSIPGRSQLFPDISHFITEYSNFSGVLLALIVGATGVPIGFSIYQIYFFLRWNSPFSRDGLIPPLISGRNQDIDIILDDLKMEDFVKNKNWKQCIINDSTIYNDHKLIWRFIENNFIEAAQNIDSEDTSVSIYSKHRYLHEVTHTLGASIISVYFGFIGYFLLKITREDLLISNYLLPVILLGGFLFLLLNREDDYEKRKKYFDETKNINLNKSISSLPIPTFSKSMKIIFIKKRINIAITHPSAIFIFGLIVVHFINNPIINIAINDSDIILKMLIIVISGYLWVSSKRKTAIDYIIGDLLSLIFVILFAFIMYFAPQKYFQWIDWSYFSSVNVFLIAIFVLYKNRQNAKDDLLMLENYTLKRFFCNSENGREKISN